MNELFERLRRRWAENEGKNWFVAVGAGVAAGLVILCMVFFVEHKTPGLPGAAIVLAFMVACSATVFLWERHVAPRLKAWLRTRAGILTVVAGTNERPIFVA